MPSPSTLRASFILLIAALAFGCGPAEPQTTDEHAHGNNDVLVWAVKQKIVDSDFEIWLGHHGDHFHVGDSIEPAVSITKAGAAFADAKVLNVLVDPNNSERTLGEEVATTFEPRTDAEIAHYAQAELRIPADALRCIVRFRIVIPDRPDHVVDVPVAIH